MTNSHQRYFLLLSFILISIIWTSLKENILNCPQLSKMILALAKLNNLSSLKLNLSNNDIKCQPVIELAEVVRQCQNLKLLELNLQQNPIGIFANANLYQQISKITQLVEFSFLFDYYECTNCYDSYSSYEEEDDSVQNKNK
ncbi:transmembrane protein, putative (macronuclear) [Tetrahymena thermophila SB210]|uniref:Transmembrane protein, putative n=1 Tax=Tetrahymena thermophila (strain SB210) TaxID=312017 RepID=W7XJF2_TETTS|nr:transmembrane protein, putative [Tetrahymena thermophila SB210]EWS75471.1 transmembrane protein, putative [Tetrahymena thermophila SB210]|eukprot:XP_012651940.1 transmembrane protein, putative [Tetrahymena thermophila SB210]